ncbi:hypothetical protein Mro03_14520 [Microbispora rosea subsp. rosea]|nr:hypothetical protein Mro03_14520 [Microbispora rosea subsp. rosea]
MARVRTPSSHIVPMETHRMLPDHERYVENLSHLSKNFSQSQCGMSTYTVATGKGSGHEESRRPSLACDIRYECGQKYQNDQGGSVKVLDAGVSISGKRT